MVSEVIPEWHRRDPITGRWPVPPIPKKIKYENNFSDCERQVYIGIDPGLTGAISVLNDKGELIEIFDMPVMAKGEKKVKRKIKNKLPIGIDEGEYQRTIEAVSYKTVTIIKNQINASALAIIFDKYKHAVATLEMMSSRPGQHAAATFSLGESYGIIQGVLASCGISVKMVTPSKWKKYLNVKADKEMTRAAAIKLYPSASIHRKKDIDRAESLLIARYGYLTKHI